MFLIVFMLLYALSNSHGVVIEDYPDYGIYNVIKWTVSRKVRELV
jgi:hypothetical protein